MSKENEKGSIKERESISEDGKGQDTLKANIKLANPLVGIPHEQLEADAVEFAKSHGLGHLEDEFRKGALIAQDPLAFESLAQLSEEDKVILRRELTNRWDQPLQLYWLVILCSISAAVQGVRSGPFLLAHRVTNFLLTDGRVGHQWCQPLLPGSDRHPTGRER